MTAAIIVLALVAIAVLPSGPARLVAGLVGVFLLLK